MTKTALLSIILIAAVMLTAAVTVIDLTFQVTGTLPIANGGTGSTTYHPTVTGILTTAMSSQTTATCTDITNMSWSVLANKSYYLHCSMAITSVTSATTAVCLNGPGTPTSYSLRILGQTVANAFGGGDTINQSAWQTKTGTVTVGNGSKLFTVDASIANGSTASGTNLSLQTAANGTNAITMKPDTSCTLTQLN